MRALIGEVGPNPSRRSVNRRDVGPNAEAEVALTARRRGEERAVPAQEEHLFDRVERGADDRHRQGREVGARTADDTGVGEAAGVAQSGRIAALMSGQLPHSFVEAVEEAGVELLPYGGELGSACSCEGWLDPCPHALAVLTQLAWLIQADPFVLTHLRGLSRDRVLRDLHRLTRPALDPESAGDSVPSAPADTLGQDVVDDLVVAEDAAVRAARLLELDRPFDAW